MNENQRQCQTSKKYSNNLEKMTKKLRIETLAEALKSCRFLFKKNSDIYKVEFTVFISKQNSFESKLITI